MESFGGNFNLAADTDGQVIIVSSKAMEGFQSQFVRTMNMPTAYQEARAVGRERLLNPPRVESVETPSTVPGPDGIVMPVIPNNAKDLKQAVGNALSTLCSKSHGRHLFKSNHKAEKHRVTLDGKEIDRFPWKRHGQGAWEYEVFGAPFRMDAFLGVTHMTKDECTAFMQAYNFRDVSLKRRGTTVPVELEPVTTRQGLVRLFRVALNRGFNFDQCKQYLSFRWAGNDRLVLLAYLQNVSETGGLGGDFDAEQSHNEPSSDTLPSDTLVSVTPHSDTTLFNTESVASYDARAQDSAYTYTPIRPRPATPGSENERPPPFQWGMPPSWSSYDQHLPHY